MSNMLPTKLPDIAPPKPPKATKRDIIEAMAEAIIAERTTDNARFEKQAEAIDKQIKRRVFHLLKKKCDIEMVSITTIPNGKGQNWVPGVRHDAMCIPKDQLPPEVQALYNESAELRKQVKWVGFGAKQDIMKDLNRRTIDRSVIVSGLLSKFRKELAETGKAMLAAPTTEEKSSAITVN